MKSVFNIGLSLLTILAASSGARAATLTVNSGGDLQAAINAAKPGDTIVLQANATFTGNFTLPAKGGTSYITIRSSAPDSSLPAGDVRMTPASASLLPKIRSNQNGPAIRTAPGATYWRLVFLEFLPSVSTSSANLVELGSTGSSQNTLSSVPHHLVVDRCYLHGDAGYGQRRGIALNSGETQITSSYFADFKGTSQDTQAISGWNGPGPFLIENNYLEAAGENIMFGGADPSIPNLVPAGITIRRNLVSKPLAWMSQGWTVKNLIEFKNAQDVVVEGNTIENNWAAGQQGYSILFTPRNQSNTAPWSIVKNITIRHNIIRHVAAVFNVAGYDNLAPSQQTENISIVNNLVYDVSTSYHAAGQTANGWLAVIGAGPKDITFDHNTVDNGGTNTIHFYKGSSPTGTNIYGFVLKNNLLRDNRYGIFGDNSSEGIPTLTAYAPGAYVHANAIGDASPAVYPTGNDYPSIAQWLADFVSVSNANYQLVAASSSKHAGTDGKDIGVDFAALNAALNGTPDAPPPPPPPPPKPTLKDFDGDGKADIAVFRPSTGQWFVLQSSGSVATYAWGLGTDQPVRGDFDGDGKLDLAVYRPSTGQWMICTSSTNFASSLVYTWGQSSDVPVPGDYDGDGKTDLAIYRPGTGEWFVLQSSSGFTTSTVHTLGLSTDVPVPSDYTGDRKTDIAVYRPSSGEWFILQSDTNFTSSTVHAWGQTTDKPVPGDYDGDGKTDLCVFRPSTGQWFILKSSANYASYTVYSWGLETDTPVAADYDGDGKADPAVFRPSTGQWFLMNSSTNYATFSVYSWGLSTDVAVSGQP